MMKKFVTALLVAAMLLVATSISWGAKPDSTDDSSSTSTSTFDLLGATWE